MFQWIKDEPVRFVAAVQATVAFVVILAAEFDVTITEALVSAFMGLVAAWLAFVTRSQVVPATKVEWVDED